MIYALFGRSFTPYESVVLDELLSAELVKHLPAEWKKLVEKYVHDGHDPEDIFYRVDSNERCPALACACGYYARAYFAGRASRLKRRH